MLEDCEHSVVQLTRPVKLRRSRFRSRQSLRASIIYKGPAQLGGQVSHSTAAKSANGAAASSGGDKAEGNRHPCEVSAVETQVSLPQQKDEASRRGAELSTASRLNRKTSFPLKKVRLLRPPQRS